MRLLRSILILPGMALVVIPALILALTRSAHIGWSLSPPSSYIPIALGLLFILLGLILIIPTIRLLSKAGRGTLAPWDPTQRLVVQGPYRYVRNPMIMGVLVALLGEAVFFGSFPLFVWFSAFLAVNAIYMPLSEEPGLEKRFGEQYQAYKENVPRWLPRYSPWEGPEPPDSDRYG